MLFIFSVKKKKIFFAAEFLIFCLFDFRDHFFIYIILLSSDFSEYYFSPRNLGKDIFLRRQMAKDGSVMLGLVASFQRVQSLTQDFNLLLEVGVYFCIFLAFFFCSSFDVVIMLFWLRIRDFWLSKFCI